MQTDFTNDQYSLTLPKMLQIENEENLLLPCCPVTEIPAWIMLRNVFFRLLISEIMYKTYPLLSIGMKPPRSQIVGAVFRSIVHNLSHRPKPSQILIRSTGVGLIEDNGRSFNRLTDYFADESPRGAWSFEDLASFKWPELPRNRNVSYTTACFSAIRLQAQFMTSPAHLEIAKTTVNIALERAEKILNWTPDKSHRDWMIAYTARRLAALPFQKTTMQKWLAKVRPSLFLVEEGCYGHMAAFNLAAREQGITVAEFQHGAVSLGHDVYNVAPVIAENSAYRNILPNIFLSYGYWWNDQFNLPIEKYVIGNPHRQSIFKSRRTDLSLKHRVLILGDGIELDASLMFCTNLATILPSDWEVIFRPHPQERLRLQEKTPNIFERFSIDANHDIYQTLNSCDAVVAELSTGLFDAINYTPRIFVLNTLKSRFALPHHPFFKVDDPTSLALALQTSDAGVVSKEQCESIWASGWRERFQNFLATCETRTT